MSLPFKLEKMPGLLSPDDSDESDSILPVRPLIPAWPCSSLAASD